MDNKKLIPNLRFPEFNNSWEEKKIKNILSIGSGKDYKHLSDGKIPVYGTGGYMRSVDKFLYEGESVCIGRKGTINKPIFLNEKFWTVDTLFYTHSFNKVLPKFVYSLFQNINWYKHNEASGVPSLSKKTIENINLNIPQLFEQEKIALFLTEVDSKLTQLTKKKALLENYKKGVMQKIFNQKIRFKDNKGNKFPNWEVKTLGEVSSINMGQSPSSNSYNKNGDGYFLIQGNADILNRITNPRHWTTEPTKLCDIGDLILTVRAPVGATAKSIHKGCIGRGVCSIKNNYKSNIEFLYQFLLDYEKKWCRLEQGSTFTAINGKDIKSIKINIPVIEEQEKIANFLSEIDNKIKTLNTKIENNKSFKKGLLQKMFV